jgi:hypothetical protein
MISQRSVKNEATVKRDIVADMKENGGYARRIEDQFGVGIYDLILIPRGLPVFMAEVKVIRGDSFGPTERQRIELLRIQEVAHHKGHVIPLMIGWKEGVYYFSEPKTSIKRTDCFSVTTGSMKFYDQLVQFYHSRRA